MEGTVGAKVLRHIQSFQTILTKIPIPTPVLYSPQHLSLWILRMCIYQPVVRLVHQTVSSRKAMMFVCLGIPLYPTISPEPRTGPTKG